MRPNPPQCCYGARSVLPGGKGDFQGGGLRRLAGGHPIGSDTVHLRLQNRKNLGPLTTFGGQRKTDRIGTQRFLFNHWGGRLRGWVFPTRGQTESGWISGREETRIHKKTKQDYIINKKNNSQRSTPIYQKSPTETGKLLVEKISMCLRSETSQDSHRNYSSSWIGRDPQQVYLNGGSGKDIGTAVSSQHRA